MRPAVTVGLRLLAIVVLAFVLIAAVATGWFYSRLRASQPQLDGQSALAGLGRAVTVTRDALGVPTVRGESRHDVARALGFLHAQERFFQMDTLRRTAAGELSEIIGRRTLAMDRRARPHEFRRIAQAALAEAAPEDRALAEAYAAGVNAGLAALPAKPWEYYALRVDPRPWLPEDTFLVGYTMMLDLQGYASDGSYERSLTAVRAKLGPAALAFFAPVVLPDDAAIDGSTAPLAPMPTPRQLDLRQRPAGTAHARPDRVDAHAVQLGSNSFAIAGNHTATGAALVANDMHLALRLPNTWYRASLEWPADLSEANATSDAWHHVTGVTLPGVPVIVAGSNGHVAWSFTNSYVDTSDLVIVQVNPFARTLYAHPDNPTMEFETRRDTILVKGAKPEEIETTWSHWGPVVGTNEQNRPLSLQWVAHRADAVNLHLDRMATATDVDAAVAVAHRAGVPALNIVVAGADGRLAWTIAGRLPKRRGFDGRLPAAWLFGDRGWEGVLAPEETPTVIVDPRQPAYSNRGYLWTANSRVIGEPDLARLGDGGYDRPARARQIRDRLETLVARGDVVPQDLLQIQLDDHARFFLPWQEKLLATLTPMATAERPARTRLRDAVAAWNGHAHVDAVGFRLVRLWRESVANLVLNPIFAPCFAAYDRFSWSKFQYEPALWAMLEQEPEHLLNPGYATWNDLLLTAVDEVIAQLDREGVPLERATWGERNTVQIRHPLAASLPAWFSGWLHLPPAQLPGANDMPRVQSRAEGASERFVVAPGREAEGIFHMPGGQSGHPLSPFYRAGHDAWVRGDPTPFLPGETVHTLTLAPE